MDIEVTPVGTGMRGKDLQKVLMVARDYKVIILVRQTNEFSLRYVGKLGYYPKPAAVKAKTADMNPPVVRRSDNGRMTSVLYDVAGLVVHPGFHGEGCYKSSKLQKASDAWIHTLETLGPGLLKEKVDRDKPETWSIWGVERKATQAPRWSWRVDTNPMSPRFGCLQLKSGTTPWSYIHGDYDLKDVIVLGRETDNRRTEGKLDGVKNFTPLLENVEFERIREELNHRMGADMVQHGAEAQFAWHGDEPITVAFPDWRHLILLDAMTVQSWYESLNRDVLAKRGIDYLRDRSRMFHFGPKGIFEPGKMPSETWG
jgi:hypothetical protein